MSSRSWPRCSSASSELCTREERGERRIRIYTWIKTSLSLIEWRNKKITGANYILATASSLWVKWGSACQHVSHTTGARLWQANVMTGGRHGPLTNPCYREPWRRTSFVSLTVDHYIIFPAGFTAVLLTDPPPTTSANFNSLTTHTQTLSGGLVSMSVWPSISFY